MTVTTTTMTTATLRATTMTSDVDADDDGLRDAILRAVDFRGDVTVTRTDGSIIEGFAFDARMGEDGDGTISLLPSDGSDRVSVSIRSIRRLAFTGKDAASGRSWENWLRRYAERKLAGEAASIECEPLGPDASRGA